MIYKVLLACDAMASDLLVIGQPASAIVGQATARQSSSLLMERTGGVVSNTPCLVVWQSMYGVWQCVRCWLYQAAKPTQ